MTDIVVGTPSAVLFPAREHKFKYLTGPAILEVPVRASGDGTPFTDYDVCPEEGVVLFGDLLKALFANATYPNLEDGQYFVLSGLALEGDTLKVAGRVVSFVEEE